MFTSLKITKLFDKQNFNKPRNVLVNAGSGNYLDDQSWYFAIRLLLLILLIVLVLYLLRVYCC